MTLRVDISDRDAKTKLVTLAGKLDTTTSPQLDDEIAPALRSDVTVLVLDLADLAYISSAGLRSVFRARKAMEARQGTLLVLNVQPQVQKVFDIVKALPSQSVFRSVAELDTYLDYLQRRPGAPSPVE